jgi:hypothetical protein
MGAPDVWPLIGVGDLGTYFVVVNFESNASSDPDTSLLRGGNIESLTRTADGRWALTLGCRDHMIQVLSAHVTVKGTVDGTGTYYNGFAYWDETVATGTTVEIQTRSEAGSLANPGSGRTIQVLLLCKMSGVNYSY